MQAQLCPGWTLWAESAWELGRGKQAEGRWVAKS